MSTRPTSVCRTIQRSGTASTRVGTRARSGLSAARRMGTVPRRPLPEDAAEHHWRDGWYFRRLSDGSVRIRHTAKQTVTPEMPIPGLETLTIYSTLACGIPADEWVAIVRRYAAAFYTAIAQPPRTSPTP